MKRILFAPSLIIAAWRFRVAFRTGNRWFFFEGEEDPPAGAAGATAAAFPSSSSLSKQSPSSSSSSCPVLRDCRQDVRLPRRPGRRDVRRTHSRGATLTLDALVTPAPEGDARPPGGAVLEFENPAAPTLTKSKNGDFLEWSQTVALFPFAAGAITVPGPHYTFEESSSGRGSTSARRIWS